MTRPTTGVFPAVLVAPESFPADGRAPQPLTRRELRERQERQQRSAATGLVSVLAIIQAPAARARVRRRRVGWSGVVRGLTSVGAMAGVAAMLVSTSISAGGFARVDVAEAAQSRQVAESSAGDVQTLGVLPQAAVAAPVLARDTYTAQSVAQQIQAKYGNRSFTYTNNPAGSIQWPFVIPSPISYGYGPRVACSYCSSFHLGVDFTPGAGTPIQSIADGVVSAVIADQWGLGNHVIVDHVVNGQRVQSVYAHMAWGSIQVAAGQAITVGTIIGAVGSTGTSTGAHLHLEVHADGTPIDPFEWLKANAN